MQELWWSQFITIALVHLLAVASPGPDFVMVLRQSVGHGRRCALWTSLGTTFGIVFHITYTLLGIGLIVSKSIFAFNVMKIGGALFLLWMGLQAVRARKHPEFVRGSGPTPPEGEASQHWTRALGVGFLTNALNPKATLFFLSFFSVIVDPRTPPIVLGLYALYMIFAHFAWYCGISVIFTLAPVRQTYVRISHWIERTMGVFLLLLGVKLLTWQRG